MKQVTGPRLRHFAVVDATLRPARVDDLRPHVLPQIGTRRLWEVWWKITKSDNRAYAGQWALGPYERTRDAPYIGWVPECDLEIHAVVKPGIDLRRQKQSRQ